MTKRLDPEQIRLEEEVVQARLDRDPERLREKLHELGFLRNPKRIDAERLMAHVDAVGGWYFRDEELEITPEYVMSVISAMSDPRSDFYGLMRRENVPANELMGRRMEVGVLAVLGQLRAKRNWHRIAREWWFGDEPADRAGKAGARLLGAARQAGLSPFTNRSPAVTRRRLAAGTIAAIGGRPALSPLQAPVVTDLPAAGRQPSSARCRKRDRRGLLLGSGDDGA